MLKLISVIKKLSKLAHRAKAMSTFVSRVSPITGKTEWVMQSEDYDYHQEIARFGIFMLSGPTELCLLSPRYLHFPILA